MRFITFVDRPRALNSGWWEKAYPKNKRPQTVRFRSRVLGTSTSERPCTRSGHTKPTRKRRTPFTPQHCLASLGYTLSKVLLLEISLIRMSRMTVVVCSRNLGCSRSCGQPAPKTMGHGCQSSFWVISGMHPHGTRKTAMQLIYQVKSHVYIANHARNILHSPVVCGRLYARSEAKAPAFWDSRTKMPSLPPSGRTSRSGSGLLMER